MTVFDVGSNIGYYTLLGSQWVGAEGRVFSFEANPGIAAVWKTSTDPNHPNVYFRARVAGASAGAHWLGLRLHGGSER